MLKQNTVLWLILLCFFWRPSVSGQNKKRPSHFKPDYIGTFSSVSVIGEDTLLFNDTLTQIANHAYDSVIIAKVRYLHPVHTIQNLPAQQLQLLTSEITRNTLEFEKTDELKEVIPSRIVDSIASLYDNRYTSYFVNYGNIWSKKQNIKYFAGRTLLISAAIVGFAVLAVLTAYSGSSSLFADGLDNDNNSDEYPFFGMHCYYMVYDKQEKQFCYIRGLHFNSDKTDNNPFNPARVEKQVESLFYLPH